MPNRVLRDGFWRSPRVRRVSPAARLTFLALLSMSDDFGFADGDPADVRGFAYAYDDNVTNSVVDGHIRELGAVGLVWRYEVGGAQKIWLPNHRNRIRAGSPKHRMPAGWGVSGGEIVPTPDVLDELERRGGFVPKRENDGQVAVSRQADDGQMTANGLSDDSRLTACTVSVSVSPSSLLESHSHSSVPSKSIFRNRGRAKLELPDWLPEATWDAWVAFRAEIKKPITPTMAEKQIEKLAKFRQDGHDPVRVVEMSIANGWQGLFIRQGETEAAEPVVAAKSGIAPASRYHPGGIPWAPQKPDGSLDRAAVDELSTPDGPAQWMCPETGLPIDNVNHPSVVEDRITVRLRGVDEDLSLLEQAIAVDPGDRDAVRIANLAASLDGRLRYLRSVAEMGYSLRGLDVASLEALCQQVVDGDFSSFDSPIPAQEQIENSDVDVLDPAG